MMKVSNLEILNSINSLQKLSDIDLPIDIGFEILKAINEIEKSLELIKKCESKLIKQYAVKDEVGSVKIDEDNQYKIPPNNVEKFNSELQNLLSLSVDLDINKIKLSDLNKENIKIKPNILFNLQFMIEE